jgi:hypothetical protein
MSYLLFVDESGHDHRNTPLEVRGGIALQAEKLWPFIKAMQALEETSFGTTLGKYGSEIKGCKLLDKRRFQWALQGPIFDDESRRKHTVSFFEKGRKKKKPKREEFTAYGQACLSMARGIFQIVKGHDGLIFASAIPITVKKPDTFKALEYLRKDHVYLLERFFSFLEENKATGLIVMDATEKTGDRRFVKRLERYFKQSFIGQQRVSRIVPVPFFVDSDMLYPIQAADVLIYCINWGFRFPGAGIQPARPEIHAEFDSLLFQMQYHGQIYREGEVFSIHGISYVPEPYTGR